MRYQYCIDIIVTVLR